jgi:hypothetical protein
MLNLHVSSEHDTDYADVAAYLFYLAFWVGVSVDG